MNMRGKILPILVFVASTLHAERVTIATYNIENYGPADRVTAAGYRKDYPKPEAEKDALRRVIRELNADVLVLQEMGARPYLDELQRDLRAEGCDYPYAALATGPDVDRHIALLSRRPLIRAATASDLEFMYFGGREQVKRGLLQATISTEAGEVTLFAVHLKSRFTDRPDDPESAIRRAAEATAVRDAVLKRFPDPAIGRFIILGDCNDSKASKSLEHLQHRGKTAVAALLPAVDGHGDVWTYYYHHDDSYSRVDHILVSPSLTDSVEEHTARVFDRSGVREASDHRPVFVVLDLPAKK
jgi:endonuclease/exonuclease/phosphatase family metal-dependent hydrolase